LARPKIGGRRTGASQWLAVPLPLPRRQFLVFWLDTAARYHFMQFSNALFCKILKLPICGFKCFMYQSVDIIVRVGRQRFVGDDYIRSVGNGGVDANLIDVASMATVLRPCYDYSQGADPLMVATECFRFVLNPSLYSV
jgi:hypothetical protein